MRSGLTQPHVQGPVLDQTPHNLDSPPDRQETQQKVLQDAIFPSWSHDAVDPNLTQPHEMAKQDPLGIQMWKLYSRTKAQLPNQERMDNLTWRMMGVNLKRKELEQARLVLHAQLHDASSLTQNVTEFRSQQIHLVSHNCARQLKRFKRI